MKEIEKVSKILFNELNKRGGVKHGIALDVYNQRVMGELSITILTTISRHQTIIVQNERCYKNKTEKTK